MNTNNLSMQMFLQNQVSADVILNESLLKIDAFISRVAVDCTSILPDAAPNGVLYILSGEASNPNKIALYLQNKGWILFEAQEGWEFFIQSTKSNKIFLNGSWIDVASSIQKNADWNATSGVEQILNKPEIPTFPTFSAVAETGSYSDLTDKPTLFSGSYEDLSSKPLLHAVATSGSYNDLQDKPYLNSVASTGDYNELSNKPYLHSVSHSGSYNDLNDKPYLHSVASSGNYNDLINKPSIPSYQNLSAVSSTGSYTDLVNKPTLFSGSYTDLTNKPTIPVAQVNSDWNSSSGLSQILNKPTLATVATSGDYNDLLNKPLSFADGFSIGDYKQSAQTSNHGKWLLCNGQLVSRTTYSVLFSLIGTSFGAGNGTTTFTLPDCRGRVNGSIGLGTGLTNRTIGISLGEEMHTLTTNEIPNHNHTNGSNGNIARPQSGSGALYYTVDGGVSGGTTVTGSTGGGAAHNNMQPTIFLGNTFIYAGA